jgi:hypothetical protein
MESIVKILTDPGAWVSGILFSLIAAAIYKWFELLPRQIRGASRAARLRTLRRIREARQNPMEIAFSIGRANAQFVAFLLMCFFYLGTLLVSESYRKILNHSWLLGVVIASPIFVFELIWLFHDSSAKRLVREHGKLLKYRSRRNVP